MPPQPILKAVDWLLNSLKRLLESFHQARFFRPPIRCFSYSLRFLHLSLVILLYFQNEVWLYISISLKLLYLNSSFPLSGYYLWFLPSLNDGVSLWCSFSSRSGARSPTAWFYHNMYILLAYLFPCWQPLSSSALHTNKVSSSSDYISVLLLPITFLCEPVLWGLHV